MASGEGRKVSRQDIQLVQNLIERCLQLYMSQKEVVNTLLHQAKIEPGFTELVWQKLEEENQEFFRAYRLRLLVKDQIVRFNELLERQVELMRQICNSPVVPSISMSNVSLMPSMRQNFAQEHVGPTLNAENLQAPLNSGIPNLYTNGASSLQPCINMPTHHPRRIDNVSPNNMLLAQTSNMGMMHGLNGAMMKSETHYSSNNSGFMFGSDNNNNNNNVLNTRPTIGDTSVSVSVSSFSTVESSSQPLNGGTILDPEESSFGFLGQIPRNFSLSDLTADFSNSSDILGSYSRSPFLETGNNNFLDPNGRGDQQDMKRLDTISENLSYEDFTSD